MLSGAQKKGREEGEKRLLLARKVVFTICDGLKVVGVSLLSKLQKIHVGTKVF